MNPQKPPIPPSRPRVPVPRGPLALLATALLVGAFQRGHVPPLEPALPARSAATALRAPGSEPDPPATALAGRPLPGRGLLDSEVPARRAPEAAPPGKAGRLDRTELALARRILAGEAGRSLDGREREQLARTLASAARDDGLEVTLVLALIARESRFRAEAIGPQGALGLMQVMPRIGADVAARHGIPWQGAETLLDPVRNVQIGVLYLAELLDAFDVAEHALAAYNVGPGRARVLLERHGSRRGPYVTAVLAHYDRLRKRYGEVESSWGI